MNQTDPARMAEYINQLRQAAESLQKMGKDIPAVTRNTTRILAGIRMLELNISDFTAFDAPRNKP